MNGATKQTDIFENISIDETMIPYMITASHAPPLAPSKQMFQQLKWLPFNEIVKFKQVSLVYKAVNGNAP